MSDREVRLALAEAAGEVLETMFFAEPAPAEDGPGVWAYAPAALVAFHGLQSGSLELCVSPELARSLAANFLGTEPDEQSPEQVQGAIGELANMVCGALLSRLTPKGSFHLDAPVPAPAGDLAGASVSLGQRFQVENGIVEALLRIHP